MNLAHTDDTELGVFADFEPKLSEASSAGRRALPRQHPARPAATGAGPVRTPRLAALDSMNLWIETTRDSLVAAIGEVDCVLLNDAEIRMLTEESNLARAARRVMELGPRIVVAKRGEYGAVLFTADGFFALPGFLLEDVRDPTGAGDSFAGGFLGYLDMQGTERPSDAALRRAMAYGTVLASFNVEEFGTERVASLTEDEISDRYEELRAMTHFELPCS